MNSINKSSTMLGESSLVSNDRAELKFQSNEEGGTFYTDSNKPQGRLGKIYAFFFFFIRPKESKSAFREANKEIANKIGEKYGSAFKNQFLEDFSSRSYWGSPITVERLKATERVYQQALNDLNRKKLDSLSEQEQKIFPELLKINQKLEKLEQQGGDEKAKQILLNQKGDLLVPGIKERKAAVEVLTKKLEGLSKKESPDFNTTRAAVHGKLYFAKQELGLLEKQKAEIIERGMGSDKPKSSAPLVNSRKESTNLQGDEEYDINGYLGVRTQNITKDERESWLEDIKELVDQENMEEESVRTSSGSWDSQGGYTTSPSEDSVEKEVQ